jgi:hypothetical protein
MVEHSTHNLEVEGSNPASGTGRDKMTQKSFITPDLSKKRPGAYLGYIYIGLGLTSKH